VDLEEFKYGGTNITAFRLVDPERADVLKVMRDWAYGSDSRFGRKPEGASSLTRVFNRPASMSSLSVTQNHHILAVYILLYILYGFSLVTHIFRCDCFSLV
jgi:hypothetical protein